MADVRPFRGVLFNPQVVGRMGDVICPPYDVISPQMQIELYGRSPYNAVRLEEGEVKASDGPNDNRYTRAAEQLRRWTREAALVQDDAPAYYLVRHGFPSDGALRHRLGLLAAVRLEDYEQGSVIPHEYTQRGPKEDRLALMERCHGNISHIMLLYRDGQRTVLEMAREATRETPVFSFSDIEGHTYEMWRLDDGPRVNAIGEMLAKRPLYIADGHHRYETSLAYRDLHPGSSGARDAAQDFVMSYLVEFDDPGLVVLPYHRVIRDVDAEASRRLREVLHRCFTETPLGRVPGDPSEPLLKKLEQQAKGKRAFGMVSAESRTASIMSLREECVPEGAGAAARFEAWVLEEMVLKPVFGDAVERHVDWIHNPQEALELLRDGTHQAAFLLNALPMEMLEEIVGSGQRLPRKSTFFHPKLPTGLAINLFDDAF